MEVPGYGPGRQSGVIDVDGTKVFVKKIILTDVELTADYHGSTANVFALPTFCQYGLGSPCFGAWRELQASLKASTWVQAGESTHFPLVYHWRVLPRLARPLSPKQRDWLRRKVEFWDHTEAVRRRLESMAAAPSSIVLFLEYVPETLNSWLAARVADQPPDALEGAILGYREQLRAAAAFMNQHGMLHFDLHFDNVLTDGERVYFADFGLAMCAEFQLSPTERAFFETHRLYDRAYLDWATLNWLAPRGELLVATPAVSRLVDRCAAVADIMQGFLKTLWDVSKATPYPAAELDEALAADANGG
jgi:hypothetical protein